MGDVQWPRREGVARWLGPRGRLPPRAQHADRRRLVHAADHLGLRHLARHARLHHRRLVDARQPGQQLPGGMSFSNDFAGDRRRRRADLPDVADAARDVRRQAPSARAARHLSALRVPGHLVDRLRLRLLVEPDLRRGGDAHRASPACRRTRATPAQRGRGPARCRARPARQRRDLVGQPDGARGDERRQLRHALGRRPRPALQRAPQRARFRSLPCATA